MAVVLCPLGRFPFSMHFSFKFDARGSFEVGLPVGSSSASSLLVRVWFIRRVSLIAGLGVRVEEPLMKFRVIPDCVLLLGAGVVGRRGGIVVAGRMGYTWRTHTAQFCWK